MGRLWVGSEAIGFPLNPMAKLTSVEPSLGLDIGLWDWDVLNDKVTWNHSNYRLHCLLDSFEPTYQLWLDSLEPEDRDQAVAAAQAGIAQKRTWTLSYRTRSRYGMAGRYLVGQGTVVLGPDGEVVRAMGTNIDVTSLWSSATHLRQTAERLGVAVGIDGPELDLVQASTKRILDGLGTLLQTFFVRSPE